MRHNTPTDNQPGTTASPRFSTDGFDCQPPTSVVDELRRNSHRPPLPPPVKPIKAPRPDWHGSALASLGVVLLAIIVMSQWRQPAAPASPVTQSVAPVPASSPKATTTPAAGWNADGTAFGRAGVIPEVRRAELVPVPIKRATLLRLPTQELGVYKWYQLPVEWGGGSVWARFMGTVGHFSDIPKNPTPGDLWNITETGTSWIYFTPAGYNHPAWIDP